MTCPLLSDRNCVNDHKRGKGRLQFQLVFTLLKPRAFESVWELGQTALWLHEAGALTYLALTLQLASFQ